MSKWCEGLSPTKYPGIWRTKTGYRVRVRALDPKTGKQKEANQHHEGISLRDAIARQSEMRETLLQSTTIVTRLRVGDFARSWIASKAEAVSKYTLSTYADFLDRHILPILGAYYFDSVTHLDVQDMVNTLLTKTKSNGTRYSRASVEDFVRVFKNMTKDAVAQLGLKQDPTLRIKLGDTTAETPKSKASMNECFLVLAAMRKSRPGSYALLSVAAGTGQRFCHVSALQWGDVDFDAKVIRFVRKQVRGVVGPISKKKPAPKELPMLPELLTTLRAHKARMEKLEYEVDESSWVFPSRGGTLKQTSSLFTALRSSERDAGVTNRVTPHRLRYAFSDLLRLAGVDEVTRRQMVGHVTEDMQQHYSTVSLDEKREAMSAVAQRLEKLRMAPKSRGQVGIEVGIGAESVGSGR